MHEKVLNMLLNFHDDLCTFTESGPEALAVLVAGGIVEFAMDNAAAQVVKSESRGTQGRRQNAGPQMATEETEDIGIGLVMLLRLVRHPDGLQRISGPGIVDQLMEGFAKWLVEVRRCCVVVCDTIWFSVVITTWLIGYRGVM